MGKGRAFEVFLMVCGGLMLAILIALCIAGTVDFFSKVWEHVNQPHQVSVVNHSWVIPQFGKGTISLNDTKCDFDIKKENDSPKESAFYLSSKDPNRTLLTAGE